MTDHIWIGGAPEVAQVSSFTIPADVEGGQVFTATIGLKTLPYTLPAGPTQNGVRSAIIALWNASTVPDFAEITASAGSTAGQILLTADEAGKPFIVTTKIGSGSNEIQVVTIGGTVTGGTFTLTYAGQTTGNIAYNASAATVDAALEALSNIGAGDVTTTGSDGGPWTVEFTGALAATDVVPLIGDDTLLTATNEEQIITLASATGGTFTLSFGGQTTSGIAYNAAAGTVETALEGLSTIGSSNVSVSGSAGGPWTVEFIGSLRGTDVAQITIDASSLTGVLAASIAETTPGSGGFNEQWHLSMYNASCVSGSARVAGNASVSGGTFTIKIERDSTTVMQTGAIAYDAAPEDVMAAFEATNYGKAIGGTYPLCFGVKAAESVGSGLLSDGNDYLLWWHPVVGASGSDYTLTINSTSLTGGSYGELGAGVLGGLSSATPTTFSSFYIDVSGQTTDDIDYDASAATIQAALEALSNIGSGNVTVTTSGANDSADPFVLKVEFIGDLANQDTGLTLNISTNNTGIGSVTSDEFYTMEGSAGIAEVQTLAITGSPVSGTFALSYGGYDTALLSYDSTAAEVETALEGLASIGSGNATCTGGDLPGSDVVITFGGPLAGSDLTEIDVIFGTSTESVTGGGDPSVNITTTQTPVNVTTSTANSGPNVWDVAANWNTNTVPVNSDNVFIVDGDNILYGLDQSAVTLGRLEIGNKETEIGLPRRNVDAIEYRETFLKIGAATIVIGLGPGNGSDRIQIDFGGTSPAIEVHASGRGSGEPAVQLNSTNATNTASLEILGGEVGIAIYPDQEAHYASIIQRSGSLQIGSDVKLLGLERTGGSIIIDEATIDGTISL